MFGLSCGFDALSKGALGFCGVDGRRGQYQAPGLAENVVDPTCQSTDLVNKSYCTVVPMPQYLRHHVCMTVSWH